MNLLGAVGSFATGVGTTDLVGAWCVGELWFKVPETVRVVFTGRYDEPTSAKDLLLYFISQIGTEKANYKAIEFYGEPIDRLSLAGRLTLASMVTEINGKIGFIPVEGEVQKFLDERIGNKVEPLQPDKDAEYLETIEIDLTNLEPQIACPHTPDNVKKVREVAGTPFNTGFIGSCTNGRFEDLEDAARILKKTGKIHPEIRLVIVPATMEVAREALSAGLYDTFFQVGAMVTNPGCSLCTIGHHGVLAAHEVLLSTSNRNFLGKLGKGSEVYLASPATVAASCVTGVITDPREFL